MKPASIPLAHGGKLFPGFYYLFAYPQKRASVSDESPSRTRLTIGTNWFLVFYPRKAQRFPLPEIPRGAIFLLGVTVSTSLFSMASCWCSC